MTTRWVARKTIIAAEGTHGDILPLDALACALNHPDSTTCFLINERFRHLAESAGGTLIATGSAALHADIHIDGRIWETEFDTTALLFTKLVRPAFEKTYRWTKAQSSPDTRPLVVGIQPLFNGALLAAQESGFDSVAISLSPNLIPSKISPPAPLRWRIPAFLPISWRQRMVSNSQARHLRHAKRQDYFWELSALRRRAGQPLIRSFSMQTLFPPHHLQIALFPDWFAIAAPDWPSHLHCVGFPKPPPHPGPQDEEILRFIARHGPPLVITGGTGVFDTRDFFAQGREICRLSGAPGLFVGGNPDERPHHPAAGLMSVAYTDFGRIFPHCRAVLHHGGIGTLAEALRAGLPQIIRPLAYDQHDNADRLWRLGLGAFFLPHKFKPRKVVQALHRLQTSAETKARLNRAATKTRREDGAKRAAHIIRQTYPAHFESS